MTKYFVLNDNFGVGILMAYGNWHPSIPDAWE